MLIHEVAVLVGRMRILLLHKGIGQEVNGEQQKMQLQETLKDRRGVVLTIGETDLKSLLT